MQNPEGGDNSSPGSSFALNDVSKVTGKREVIFAFDDTEGGLPCVIKLYSQAAFNHKIIDITIDQRCVDEKCTLLAEGCKRLRPNSSNYKI